MNLTMYYIMLTFFAILRKGKTHYCEPRPDKIRELLKKFYKTAIGRSWFFQCCRNLEDMGFMRRQRRWIHPDEGGIESISSLWWFTLEGLKYLKSRMVYGANDLVRRTLEWLHRNDERKPGPSDIAGKGETMERDVVRARLRELIQGIGNGPAGGTTPATT